MTATPATGLLALDPTAQDLLFRVARTANTFTAESVTDEQIQAMHELVRLGPTGYNSQPLRILLLRSAVARARLLPHLSSRNLAKTATAPLTAILAADTAFHEHLPRLYPDRLELPGRLVADPAGREAQARLNTAIQIGYLIVGIRAAGLAAAPVGRVLPGRRRRGVLPRRPPARRAHPQHRPARPRRLVRPPASTRPRRRHPNPVAERKLMTLATNRAGLRRIGAEITGIDLTEPLDEVTTAELNTALLTHKALFFRGQQLDDAGQARFAGAFGPLTTARPTVPARGGNEHVLAVDGEEGARANTWHTDVTFALTRPKASTLRALVIPPYGGERSSPTRRPPTPTRPKTSGCLRDATPRTTTATCRCACTESPSPATCRPASTTGAATSSKVTGPITTPRRPPDGRPEPARPDSAQRVPDGCRASRGRMAATRDGPVRARRRRPLQNLARIAERGKLDSLFLADGPVRGTTSAAALAARSNPPYC